MDRRKVGASAISASSIIDHRTGKRREPILQDNRDIVPGDYDLFRDERIHFATCQSTQRWQMW